MKKRTHIYKNKHYIINVFKLKQGVVYFSLFFYKKHFNVFWNFLDFNNHLKFFDYVIIKKKHTNLDRFVKKYNMFF